MSKVSQIEIFKVNIPFKIAFKHALKKRDSSESIFIKIALDNGVSGALLGPSAYLKKSPPVQYDDNTARAMMEEFIATYGKKKGKRK